MLTMEANGTLEVSLKKFKEKFEALAPRHFSDLKPIGDTIFALNKLSGDEAASFPAKLVKFSEAVIQVRKNPSSAAALKDLPVPPYDLWIPFKAEGATQVKPETFAEARGVFDKKLSEFAAFWRPFAELQSDEFKAPDPDLSLLHTRIKKQFLKCNESFSEVTAMELFDPTRQAYSDFFERKINTPVDSADDFQLFITCLNKVFYEGLPTVVKEWRSDQALPDSLTHVAKAMAVIKGESFRWLKILRNKPVHDDSNALRALAPIYNELIGEGIGNPIVKAIGQDSAEKWLSLQKAVLEMLASSLEDLHRAFK